MYPSKGFKNHVPKKFCIVNSIRKNKHLPVEGRGLRQVRSPGGREKKGGGLAL